MLSSHLAILEGAGEKSVLIIEDDCDFGAKDVKVPDCDIFYGGYLGKPEACRSLAPT